MAQTQRETQTSTMLAERDAAFISEHPVQGRIVQAGAMMTGAGEAVQKSVDDTVDLLKQTYTPGDQRKIPHPLDDVGQGVSNLKHRFDALLAPGDMKIENAPHPVDKALHAIESKVNNVQQAGLIEGARIAAAATVGPVLDTLGPSGKVKTAERLLEGVTDVAQITKVAKHVNDAVTNSFLHDAVQRTEKQLVNAMEDYEKTARSAKTYGENLGRYDGHGDALVKFQIASVRLDALKHGGDASIKNPVIADLTKNGTASEHFYSGEIMRELKQFNPQQMHDYQTAARDMATDATKAAHENRLNMLQKLQDEGKPLTSQQVLEVNIGRTYGPDAAANARELMTNGQGDKVRVLYPEKEGSAGADMTRSQVEKAADGRVNLSDAVNHLEHPQAKAIVLARIAEQQEQTQQRQTGIEMA